MITGWSSNTLATWCEELTCLKRPWCWEGLRAGGEGDDGGWDDWMASPTQWTWVRVNSGSWWWTERPHMLQFMGSQRVGHNWATELNYDNIGPTQINQNSVSMLQSWSAVFIQFVTNLNSLFPCNITYSEVPGISTWMTWSREHYINYSNEVLTNTISTSHKFMLMCDSLPSLKIIAETIRVWKEYIRPPRVTWDSVSTWLKPTK